RISAITGLHRHVVSDIVNSDFSDETAESREKDYRRNRLARVLAGWYESPPYTDSDGMPLVLAADGPAPSFATLVQEFSGDIYPGIILDELLEVGAVAVEEDGRIRSLSRRYTTGGTDPVALQRLGNVGRDVFGTLEHNLAKPPEQRLYDDSVVSMHLDRAALPLFRRLMRQRGAAFLEDIEGWVAEHEKPGAADAVRAGVTIQMFVDELPEQAGSRESEPAS
ncbi:MAG TPA: DUF6502 family protein, partial [Gemmatimonadaceae bacterium]|nr:DUF6502 family protein [Gemmatimonadaceae bacterium]